MGNFKNIETDFIERTLHLLSQYESVMHQYLFEQQYNYTLLTNCLLGLIVMPKEKTISYLPKDRINEKLKSQMGIVNSIFNPEIINMKDLIVALRHSIAHFDISFESVDDGFLINKIVFKDREKEEDYIVASFEPQELLSFLRYYGHWLISNIQKYGNQ